MTRHIGLAVALALMLAGTASAQITVGAPTPEEPNKRSIRFTEYHAINTITDEIDSCYRMWFVWDRGTAGAVSAYAVEPADDEFAEVEAGALIRAFTADETYGPITPTDSKVRFVVDTQETGSESTMTVHCSNDLASGGGSVDGSAPASGVDSVITVYENSDYDGDTTVWHLDADTDLLRSNTNRFSEMGFPTDRTMMAKVDDDSVGVVQGYVRWFTGTGDTGAAGDANRLSEQAGILAAWTAVTPAFGGRLTGKALGVFVMGTNTGTNQSCRLAVHRNTAMNGTNYPALATGATGATTNWTECTGALEIGPVASNSGGVGTSGVVDNSGEQYMVPLTDCECTIDECVLVVAVEDRDEGGSETCTDIEDINVTLLVGETPQ